MMNVLATEEESRIFGNLISIRRYAEYIIKYSELIESQLDERTYQKGIKYVIQDMDDELKDELDIEILNAKSFIRYGYTVLKRMDSKIEMKLGIERDDYQCEDGDEKV